MDGVLANTHTRYVEGTCDDVGMDYVIYTDGGYSIKANIGAYAYVMLNRKGKVVKQQAKKMIGETNNRAEIKAILNALYDLPEDATYVCVVSDSQYALKTCAGIWARKSNTDLFDWLDAYLKRRPLDITFRWVRGHSGDQWNEKCDELCNQAAGMDLNAEYSKYKK